MSCREMQAPSRQAHVSFHRSSQVLYSSWNVFFRFVTWVFMTHTLVTFLMKCKRDSQNKKNGVQNFSKSFLKIHFWGPKAQRMSCRLEIWHVFGRRHHTPGHTMQTSMHSQNSAVTHTFWRASYTFCSLVCDILIVILGRSGGVGSPVSPNTLNSYGLSGYNESFTPYPQGT